MNLVIPHKIMLDTNTNIILMEMKTRSHWEDENENGFSRNDKRPETMTYHEIGLILFLPITVTKDMLSQG